MFSIMLVVLQKRCMILKNLCHHFNEYRCVLLHVLLSDTCLGCLDEHRTLTRIGCNVPSPNWNSTNIDTIFDELVYHYLCYVIHLQRRFMSKRMIQVCGTGLPCCLLSDHLRFREQGMFRISMWLFTTENVLIARVGPCLLR
jgi:hypothetical protein